jgi:phosphatidate phosphatase APP1
MVTTVTPTQAQAASPRIRSTRQHRPAGRVSGLRWAPVLAAAAMFCGCATLADTLHNIVDDGWVTPQGLQLSGRVTEAHALPEADSSAGGTLWHNTKLLFGQGVSAPVTVTAGTQQWQAHTDAQGHWRIASDTAPSTPPPALAPGWYTLGSTPAASGPAALLVHDPRNTLGIISDIDDTILVSEVNDKTRLLRNSLTLPPEQRLAVPGMAALYQRWSQRNPNPAATPVFYVSASPRQLSDGIRRFLRLQGFPPGVLQLKDVGPGSSDPLWDQQGYKVRRISAILQAFPGVRFVLLGDDGERDPESYAQLQAQFPAQVAGVWIRHVNPDPARAQLAGQQDTDALLRSGPP